MSEKNQELIYHDRRHS